MKVPLTSRSSARLAWVSLGVADALSVFPPSVTGEGPPEPTRSSTEAVTWSVACAATAPEPGATRGVSSRGEGGHGHLSLSVEKPESDSLDAPRGSDDARSLTASFAPAPADRDAVEHRRLRNAIADHDARGPPRG